jgi:FtsP/CotA-like multicopper oxidase with cupredoxin domain
MHESPLRAEPVTLFLAMQRPLLIAVLAAALAVSSDKPRAALPIAAANPNTAPAGRLRGEVLELELVATLAMWHPDGDSRPGIRVEAFAEPGKRPQVPAPLIRVPQGTEIRVSVRNALINDTLTFSIDIGDARDSVVVPPGSAGTLRVRPARAGNFFYRATTSTTLGRALRVGGMLAGALVIDSAGSRRPRDRIFVIQVAADAQIGQIGIPLYERSVWAINGRSWPSTERLDATVGESVRWRVINLTTDGHPMHLHGFYYSVDAVDGPSASLRAMEAPSPRVVTARLAVFAGMSMTWVPERGGNWLFHCHFADHVIPHGPLGGESPAAGVARIGKWPTRAEHAVAGDHSATAMAGLITGIVVRERRGARAATAPAARRILRLVAIQDPEFPDSQPSLRYVLDDPLHPSGRVEAWPGLSVPINLNRDEPVAITIVNQMREPTSVHWHGIELDSYADGVPGFSGAGTRLTPLIAPGDSFVAHFTPPRSGTFMYHSHVDEPRQQRAGLVGPLIVRDAGNADTTLDVTFLFKLARFRDNGPFEINGKINPDTLRLRAGQKYRLRLIALQNEFPYINATLTARVDSAFTNVPDQQVVQWTPVAKDGAELPAAYRVPRLAGQQMSMGEIYDFEFVPTRAGTLRLELRRGGRLAARTPILVY